MSRRILRIHTPPARIPLRTLLLLIMLLVIGIVVYPAITRSKWDGIRRFTVVYQNQSSDASLREAIVVSLEPQNNQGVVVIRIPAQTLLKVPFGYGSYVASSVYKLGVLDKKHGGGLLLAKSVESTLGVLVEGYFIPSSASFFIKTKEDVWQLKKKYFSFLSLPLLFSSFVGTRKVDTNLTFLDRIRLWNAIRVMRSDQIAYLDLGEETALRAQNLADGTEVYALDPDLADLILGERLYDSLVFAENITVEIRNATDQDGVASDFARTLQHLGAHVIAKTSAKQKQEKACYLHLARSELLSSTIVRRLQEVYLCQILEQKEREESQSDVQVVLGKEFLE